MTDAEDSGLRIVSEHTIILTDILADVDSVVWKKKIASVLQKKKQKRKMRLVKTISDSQQVLGRPEMDVDFFCRPGVGMSEANANELDRDTFSVQGSAEIVPECMRSESWYPGMPGKFFTETVKTAS
ncbi:hypothetical protein ES703_38654 [subsurface metagenome]